MVRRFVPLLLVKEYIVFQHLRLKVKSDTVRRAIPFGPIIVQPFNAPSCGPSALVPRRYTFTVPVLECCAPKLPASWGACRFAPL